MLLLSGSLAPFMLVAHLLIPEQNTSGTRMTQQPAKPAKTSHVCPLDSLCNWDDDVPSLFDTIPHKC